MRVLYILLLAVILGCDTAPSVKPIGLFTLAQDSTQAKALMATSGIETYTTLNVVDSELSKLYSEKPDSVAISLPYSLPYANINIVLLLKKIDVFTNDFKLMANTNTDSIQIDTGLYYFGKVRGDSSSVVTLNIFQNDLNGVISSNSYGTLNIGKYGIINAKSSYLMYTTSDDDNITFECGSEQIEPKELKQLRSKLKKIPVTNLTETAGATTTLKTVTVDFELSHFIYQYFGNSIPAATNWLTSIFSGVKAIYLNEGINIAIKSVYIWTTPDGYDPSNAANAINQVQAKRKSDPSFTGHLTHLVIGKDCSNCPLMGIAYLGTLCVNQYRFAVSQPLMNYAAYPNYSWSVEVLAHELGHNLGSPHTHSCSWPGGPIDNCAPQEGSCAAGPTPPFKGGTIMSYCHQKSSIGINFANGFGKLPGDKIRADILACLGTEVVTPPAPSCTDGIKNGNELGVDCGGSCPPCPSTPAPSNLDPIISIGKPTTQSSNYNSINSYPATNASDGRINGANFNHTAFEINPSLQIDLQQSHKITRIAIYPRWDCCHERLKNFAIQIDGVSVYTGTKSIPKGDSLVIPLNVSGKIVRLVGNNNPPQPLHISEMFIRGSVGTVACKDTIYKVLRDSTGKVCR
jgi:hypothetical protein